MERIAVLLRERERGTCSLTLHCSQFISTYIMIIIIKRRYDEGRIEVSDLDSCDLLCWLLLLTRYSSQSGRGGLYSSDEHIDCHLELITSHARLFSSATHTQGCAQAFDSQRIHTQRQGDVRKCRPVLFSEGDYY